MNHSTLTLHEYNGIKIPQRPDGYIDATRMCQVAGKAWSEFLRLTSTQKYLKAAESVLGISQGTLIESRSTGTYEERGTWIHPRLASRLAQWISPEFAVIVDGWVIDIFEGKHSIASHESSSADISTPQQRLDVIERSVNLLEKLDGVDDITRHALTQEIRDILAMTRSTSTTTAQVDRSDEIDRIAIEVKANSDIIDVLMPLLQEAEETEAVSGYYAEDPGTIESGFLRFFRDCVKLDEKAKPIPIKKLHLAYWDYCFKSGLSATSNEGLFRDYLHRFYRDRLGAERRVGRKLQPACFLGIRLKQGS